MEIEAEVLFNQGLLAEEGGDRDAARALYERAAELGHATATFNAGALAAQVRDWTNARIWWTRSAENGDRDAMRNLGFMAQQAGDLATARTWYRRGADLGSANCMNDLGFLAQEEGDLATARMWYRRAADHGEVVAYQNLGVVSVIPKSAVDLHANIYPEFPEGWNSATDLMEGFLLAAALEYRARQALNPLDPMAAGLAQRLPDRYRWDTFGSLLIWGPYSESDYRNTPVSSDPTTNRLLHEPMLTSGERIGRLPLLAMVWQFTDQILREYQHLRGEDRVAGYQEVISQVGGTVLHQYGTVLFMAAFEREWLADDPTELSPVEGLFVAGESIRVDNSLARLGFGVLNPLGDSYKDAIWQTAFRLVERRTPDYYIHQLGHRYEVVADVLDRGAQLASSGARSIWPGWSA